ALGFKSSAADRLDQELNSFSRDFGDRLPNACQGRRAPAARLRTVESDDRNVIRNSQSCSSQRLHTSEGVVVRPAEDCRRIFIPNKLEDLIGAVEAFRRIDHQRWGE